MKVGVLQFFSWSRRIPLAHQIVVCRVRGRH